MADDAVAKVGALIEQLGARFELVLEAVSGFGGRLESLREEMRCQFDEVGKQIRFLAEQIAINRQGQANLKADLAAEIVRLGETLGKTRIEFREQRAEAEARVRKTISVSTTDSQVALARAIAAGQAAIREQAEVTRESLAHSLSSNAAKLRAGLSSSADAAVRKLDAELKRASKTLASLAKKFDRFDDRITIHTRDQEQRVRKLERQSRGRG